MTENKIRVMGETWILKEGSEEEFPALDSVDGYADTSTRTIVVSQMLEHQSEPTAKEKLSEYKKTVIRHEIIHAFLYESGLENSSAGCTAWAVNEEMVDWIAIQAPKIIKVFLDLDLV